MGSTDQTPDQEDTNTKGQLVAEIDNRLQFVTVISIFFCTLLYSFFRSINRTDADSNKALTKWAGVAGAYLLNYLLFETFRSRMRVPVLKFVNVLTLLGMALFVLPIFVIATVDSTHWLPAELWLAQKSFIGIIVAPFAILFLFYGVMGNTIADRIWRTAKRLWELRRRGAKTKAN